MLMFPLIMLHHCILIGMQLVIRGNDCSLLGVFVIFNGNVLKDHCFISPLFYSSER